MPFPTSRFLPNECAETLFSGNMYHAIPKTSNSLIVIAVSPLRFEDDVKFEM
jgi:hypothetical protein